MNQIEKIQLTKQEEQEIRIMINEATSIYEYIKKNNLNERWMGDSEQFMGFTFFHTKQLVKHSITLSKLTRWLIGLTIALVILSIVQIILFIIGHT